jgi:molybdate transport system ATP-binding protein
MTHPLVHPLVQLERVSVSRTLPSGEKNVALEGIDWVWKRGETWAFRGRNGSGKSTLLRVIKGDQWFDTGGSRQYGLDETLRNSPLSVKDRIALISPESQEWYLSSGYALSVRQVISSGFYGELLPYRQLSSAQQQRLLEQSEALAVQDWLERDIRSLSNGQRRQVLLARALVGDPLALLLDEFFEGIDQATSVHLREQMQQLSQQIPTLYTGHRQGGELEFASHELWLERGKIRPATKPRLERLGSNPTETETEIPAQIPTAPHKWIELEHVHVQRGSRVVLQDISWTMESNQNWVILGHNGAGKSTLCQLIRRELYPLLGGTPPAVVRRFGLEGGSSWEIWKKISLVSSEITSAHRSNVSEISATGHTVVASGFESFIGIEPPLSPAQEQKIALLMDFFEVDHLAQRPANQMSAGEIKKCLLARALVADPKIIILDEPFDYLDSSSKKRLMHKISTLEQTRFIVIAHRPEDIPENASHLMRLERGRIEYQGVL